MMDAVAELWAGMVDVGPSPGGPIGEGEGAYAYCAGQADGLPDFLAQLTAAAETAGLELKGIDWIARHATLPERMRLSDAVIDVVKAALDSGEVAFDHIHVYADEDEPEGGRLDALKTELEAFVGDWLDGAVDAYDAPFAVDSYTFIAELDFGGDSTITWAGRSADPVDLLRRALDALED
jgi:hypothetical protein